MPFGPTHTIILQLATWAVKSFYRKTVIIGEENIPAEGPVIVASNHHNMAVDPAVLSVHFPFKLHYWAKDSLFKNPYARTILLDAGNIPVDRKNKNNQQLYAGTFDVLKKGEAVAIFPEGTSYTEPAIRGIKNGISYTALEYAKNLREQGNKLSDGSTLKDQARDVVIVVAGLNYTNKSKYRSSVAVEYAPAIDVKPYVDEFLKEPKAAAQKLSDEVLRLMRTVTVNAPDWDTLKSAQVASQLLWRQERELPLLHYREVSQALVELFTEPSNPKLKTLLASYADAQKRTGLTNDVLGPLTLPRTLDPNFDYDAPTRASALLELIRDSLSCAIRLPFFVLPLLVHLPVYISGKLTLNMLNQEEPESFAQTKIFFGLFILTLTYPIVFVLFWWALFARTAWLIGAVLAFGATCAMTIYHEALVDDNYVRFKRLAAAWQVLGDVWRPKVGAGGKPEESDVRRTLKLRTECARQLLAHLNEVERQGGQKAAIVSKLRSHGARLGRGPRKGMLEEDDGLSSSKEE